MVLPQNSVGDLHQTVNQVLELRQITHQKYHQLCAAIFSDTRLSEAERLQVNRLLDAIQVGHVKVVY
jgi:hypothetical protein